MSKWKALGKLGLNIAEIMVPEIRAIETAVKAFKTKPTGAEKKAAVLAIVRESLAAGESLSDRDILDDAEVSAAASAAIDAIVHLHNVVEKKKAA